MLRTLTLTIDISRLDDDTLQLVADAATVPPVPGQDDGYVYAGTGTTARVEIQAEIGARYRAMQAAGVGPYKR